MAEETKVKAGPEEEGPENVTFKCAYCKEDRPIGDMRTIRRFFPVLVVCQDCEKKIR